MRGLRTSLKGAQLGDGYFQAIKNLRWDTGALTVRNGIATVSASAPGTTCLGAWSGPLNGTWYVVSAWVVSGKTAIYTLNLGNGAFAEITSLAGYTGGGGSGVPSWGGSQATAAGVDAGGTRLSNTTNGITFCVHTVPRRVVNTQAVAPFDVLSISNGEDFPLIYNPAVVVGALDPTGMRVLQQKNIVTPAGASQFNTLARFSAFFPVAAASGKTYTNNNATHSKFAASTVAPYNSGANTCIDFVAATPNTGDTCKIAFASGVGFPGEQLNWIIQGTTANISEFLSYTKVEASADDSTYYPFYDPSSTDATATILPQSTPLDSGNNRTMLTFSLKNVPATARTLRYVRTTRITGATVSYTLTLLVIAGAGNGGGFFGGTEFQFAYADHFGGAESGGFTGSDLGGDLIANCGGPNVVTSGSSSTGGTKVPVSTTVLYDYGLHIVNPGAFGTLYGGLNGYPDALDIYFRTPAEAAVGLPALYWTSLKIYEAGISGSDHIWLMIGDWSSAGPGGFGGTPNPQMNVKTEGGSYAYLFGLSDRDVRDPSVPAPSPFNIALPRATAVWSANQRSFAGQIKDPSGGYQRGDLYISDLTFPFRFVSVQGSSPDSGTRLTFDGEKVMAGVMTAAGANGASIIYVLTDQSLNALGTAGGFVGSGYDATSLATRVRINASGTPEPGSVQENRGVIFYIDQQGQIIRFAGGGGTSISRNTVDDKTKNIPASQRGKASSAFFADRYYLAYTPLGGSSNTHVLGWNEILEEWEFDDTLPSTVVAQRLVRAYDSSQTGHGQRLLVFSGDGKVYAYEEGSAEPGSGVGPSVQIRTREYQTPDLNLFRFGKNQIMADAQSAALNIDRFYKGAGSQYRSTVNMASSTAQAVSLDSQVPTEITGTGLPEEGWSSFIDLNGNLAAGTVLWRWETDLELRSKGAGAR